MAEYSHKWYNKTSTKTKSTKTSDGLAAIQAQLNNLRREIKKVNEKVYVAQVRCKLHKGPHYTKDYPLKEEGKTLKEAYYTQFAIRNQGATIKTLEIQIGQMRKVLQERGFGSLPSSMQINPRDHVKSISTIKVDSIEIRLPFPRRLHDYCCDERKEAHELKILETTLHDNTLPQKEKDLGSFTLPCFIHNVCFDKALADLGASDKTFDSTLLRQQIKCK
ncbi:hypothetical protein Tco_0280278 [Tanacetum coccineum]